MALTGPRLQVLGEPALGQPGDLLQRPRFLEPVRRAPPRPSLPAQRPVLASQPSTDLAGGLTRRPWRRLKRAAGALGKDSPDAQWEAGRIRAKRGRYGAQAVTQ